jgi:hypothetical protein
MKTFEELLAEGTITIELDHAGDSKEIKEFMAKAKEFKPKLSGSNKTGAPYQTVTLTGDRKKLEDWCYKNYDDDMEFDDYII